MLNFVICDDNKSILDRLSKILDSIFIKHYIDAQIVFSSTNPFSVLDFVNQNKTNVLVLDIDLKSSINGIDLVEKMRKTNKDTYVIFTSAHLEYILIAYKCKTFDFIPKPFTYEKIEQTILRLIEDINYSKEKKTFIKLNKNILVDIDDILYIQKDGMKSTFYLSNGKNEVYYSFNKLISSLPNYFVRCHKSYIVNTNKINSINIQNNSIIFSNSLNNICYIGPKYKENLLEVLNYDDFSRNMDVI